MAESTFKLYSKRRRSRALLAQAGLGVLIVALLFGISYAAVRIIYGQPLLRARAAVSAAPPAQPGGAFRVKGLMLKASWQVIDLHKAAFPCFR